MIRRGFVYSLFALFALNLLVLSIVLPQQIDRDLEAVGSLSVDELFYFLQSVEDDIERGAATAFQRSLIASTNFVVNNGSGIDDPAGTIELAFYNGTLNGSVDALMEQSSFVDWVDSMEGRASQAGYDAELMVGENNVSMSMPSPFTAEITVEYDLLLADPSIETRFDRDGNQASLVRSIEGLDDPLVLLETDGRYSKRYEQCSSSSVAEKVETGDAYEYNYTSNGSERTWVSGDSVVRTGGSLDDIDDMGERVLVTDDLCQYSYSDLDAFAGVVSNATTDGQDVCGSGEEIGGYIGGVSSSSFVNGSRLVMDEDAVWNTSIPEKVETGCYIGDTGAPGFMDRLRGDLSGTGQGIVSFLEVPALPSAYQQENRSALDAVYFAAEGSYGDTHRIKGMTDWQGWFRLDDDHVNRWGIEALTY